MTTSQHERRIEIARTLNRADVSAAPLVRLDAISIFDDEWYENYDHDAIGPRQRWRLAKALKAAGFHHRSGRRFDAPDDGPPVLFPRPGMLGTDPSRPADELLQRAEGIVLVTPTQALLLLLHRFGDQGPEALREELVALVWDQPANLDKAHDWLRASARAKPLTALRNTLAETQAEGTRLRRQRRFVSKLPR